MNWLKACVSEGGDWSWEGSGEDSGVRGRARRPGEGLFVDRGAL